MNLPALPYLIECSESALQELELKSLDLAAQCRKRARAEQDQSDRYIETAGICRFLLNHRSEMIDLAKLVADGKQRTLFFVPDRMTA